MRRLRVALHFLNATGNADVNPWRVWTSNLRSQFWETEVNTRLRQCGYSFGHHAWLVKFYRIKWDVKDIQHAWINATCIRNSSPKMWRKESSLKSKQSFERGRLRRAVKFVVKKLG
jgi:hypothetical protein